MLHHHGTLEVVPPTVHAHLNSHVWTWTNVCRKKIICLVKQSSSMERTNAWGDMWSPYDGINISWLASKVPQFFFLWIPQNFVHNSTRGMQSQNREYYQTIVTSHQALWQLRNFWLQRMRVISSSQIILSTRPCDTRWAYTCTQAVLALFLCVCCNSTLPSLWLQAATSLPSNPLQLRLVQMYAEDRSLSYLTFTEAMRHLLS